MYNINNVLPPDGGNESCFLLNMWQDFSRAHGVPLYICIGAVFRRGILRKNDGMFRDNEYLTNFNIFHICGLSNILEKLLFCDRFIQF